MERFQDIFISCEADLVPSVFDQIVIRAGQTPDWIIDNDWMAEIENQPPYIKGRYLDLSYLGEGGSPIATVVLLHDPDGRLFVPNIIPREEGTHELGISRYNAILTKFYDEILAPVMSESFPQCRVQFTSGKVSIEDYFPPEIAKLLRRFSTLANKGGLHPNDRERWRTFLIAAYKQQTNVGSDVVRRLLEEELGWPEEMAQRLAGEYYEGLKLLKAYDESG